MCDLLVESGYVWVGGVSEAELVTLVQKLYGCVREVWDAVGDVAGGVEVFGGGEENFVEMGFTGICRGGWLKKIKCLLSFPSEGLPVRFPQVGEGDAG